VELLDPDDRACFQVARHWRSATPYAPPRRFWGVAGKRHHDPERQAERELQAQVPAAGEVRARILGACRARLRLPPGEAPKRPMYQPAFDLLLEMDAPICGPLALGYSNHFGLGLFLPE
jgi:CRISPR-associated protein Csb2